MYGNIIEYTSGSTIRPASREDWQRSRELGDAHTGAHLDTDGSTLIFCDGPAKDPDAFDPKHFRATALAADEAAIAAYRGGAEDGGSCNFDEAVLHMPAAWREQVLAAAADTGLAIDTRHRNQLILLNAEPPSQSAIRNINAGRAISRVQIHDDSPKKTLTPVPNPAPELRPFFGFYGGKWRDACKYYPKPEFPTIIEPFAGSAGYSVRYPQLKVILCEVDPILAEVWKYLIRVKPKEILTIRDMKPSDSVDDLKICQEARWLVGLWLNRGVVRPRKTPSRWMREGIRPGSFWGERVRATIASQVESIRHWQIYNCSYTELPLHKNATWFIDPPYQQAGQHYRFGSSLINYTDLAGWCRSRSGQVIVCENAGADWLPFRRLADVKTTRADRLSKEVYWLNEFTKHRIRSLSGPS